MNAAESELRAALRDEASLLRWLEDRGYVPLAPDKAPPLTKRLAGARFLIPASAADAPLILLLWDPTWSARATSGSELRTRQREVNEYQISLRANSPATLPSLCVAASPDFLVGFVIDGDPFSRRVRFTPSLLSRPGGKLEQSFERFRAATFATWARRTAASKGSFLSKILGAGEGARLSWDFTSLFGGARLDDDFVKFMGDERRRIAELILRPEQRDTLLRPMWGPLAGAFSEGRSPDVVPQIEEIARVRKLRSALFAAIDTVLLRLVLYRYLEAQFGYHIGKEEQRSIALGTYDEVIEKTVRVDSARRAARVAKGGQPQQLGLFATVDQPEIFRREVRERADWYQQQAGGDLHQGAVAEAANVLQDYLILHQQDTFAELIAGTSTGDYSFHYADLDARAFQQFYEQTISADLHLSYDRSDRSIRVQVVSFERNRKEQGAYYTPEELCRWLVERTLGKRYEAWAERFRGFLQEQGKIAKGRLPAVRAYLDELMGWRVLDPTCGGGIFLRAAFESLSRCRGKVMTLLELLPEEARRQLVAEPAYQVFSEGAEQGEWEWHILLHMLYGVDVDVKAINVASNLLTLSALTYKRNGICFPSFINMSLKPGNALLNPLRPAQRAEFLERNGGDLRDLLALRARLRDPLLSRGEWQRLHGEAALLTRAMVNQEIEGAYGDLFKEAGSALLQRVQRVGVFLYEAEFPEAFFEIRQGAGGPEVALRENPGFDVVIGNPPWEEPAAQYKQFLPEFDPEYLALTGFASQQREEELLKDVEIQKRWVDFCSSVSDYKALLTTGWYQHQKRRVRGKIPGAHTNLFKYATEMSWHLLRQDGAAGLVIDSGLWSDLAASGLRSMLLDNCKIVEICGFTNNEGLFDIHRSYKFSATVFHKGGRAATIKALFMCRDFKALDSFEHLSVAMEADAIRTSSRDSYPVPEVRSTEHYQVERAFLEQPRLMEPPWEIETYSEELNAARKREHFMKSQQPGSRPLIQGRQFNLFGVHFGDPIEAWVDPQNPEVGQFLRGKQEKRIFDAIFEYIQKNGFKLVGGKRDAAREWIKALTGNDEILPDWLRLDWDGYRIAWRDVTRNDDKRTTIAAIIPPGVAVTHKAPYIRPFRLEVTNSGIVISLQYSLPQMLYLAGCLSSFACDSVARTSLAKPNLTADFFQGIPVPPWRDTQEQRRVAELCARLTCLPATQERPWADYTALAAAVGLVPERDGLRDPAQRREAEVELNALVARLYGLGQKELRFLMDTLFMTPKHKENHAALRDAIAARL